LIAPDVVLTAAHCIEPRDNQVVSGLKAYVGATVPESVENGAVLESCLEWKDHPGYNAATVNNDFALCRLENPVEIDDNDVFLELNNDPGFPSEDDDDVMTEVSGMGYIDGEETNPDVLMRIELPLLDNATCKAKNSDFNEATMICTESNTGNTCQGDSGGPVVVVSPSSGGRIRHTQIGVVSWGLSCLEGPNFDARVSASTDWIQTVVCDEWGIQDAGSLCETLPSPTAQPTRSPTASPTRLPTASPTRSQTASPTARPSMLPSDSPSEPPSTIKSGKNGKKATKKTKKEIKKENKKEKKKEKKKGD